jgi:hypothetical protein
MQHFSRYHFFSFLFLRLLLLASFFRVVGGRYLEDGVDKKAKVWLFVANAKVKVLINFVESLWVNPFSEIGVFFSPVLENKFKIGTYAYSFL